jgi:hypothetical protein
VESRLQPLDVGMSALRDALSKTLAEPTDSLDDACQVITQMLREQSEDDMTLVLARIRP